MSIEDDLRRALRRNPAPPGFGDRVIARVTAASIRTGTPAMGPTPAAPPPRRRAPILGTLAAAAALALVATAGARYFVEQQTRAEAERVTTEIRIALQITSEKLALAQRKIQDGPADAGRERSPR